MVSGEGEFILEVGLIWRFNLENYDLFYFVGGCVLVFLERVVLVFGVIF